MSLLQVEDVLLELRNLKDRNFSFAFCSDWYSHQDLASYIRVVSALRTLVDCSLPSFVAWVLAKDPTWPDREPEVWLANCKLTPTAPSKIEKAFLHIQPHPGNLDTSDLPYGWDDEIPVQPSIIPPNALEGVTTIYTIEGLRRECNKRNYGPTHIHFWERGAWLFYFEEHLES